MMGMGATSSKSIGTFRQTIGLATIVGALCVPAMASAQGQPDVRARAEAQKLYEDGAKDMEADAYSRACPKFEAAWKILPDHIRTGVTLAECLDKLGKPASALSVLEAVAGVAKTKNDKNKLAEIEEAISDLDKRVPKLTLHVPADIATTPGFAISRNGLPVPSSSWETPSPVDPGEYEFEATAVDKPAWKKAVQMTAGNVVTVEVEPGWEKPKKEALPSITPSAPTWPARARVAGIVGLGLGAVGLGTWGVLGGLAISKNNASKSHCSSANKCDAEGFHRREEAIALGHGATAALIAGGIFAAAGVSLILVAGSGKKDGQRDAAISVTNVWVGPTGVGIRGNF